MSRNSLRFPSLFSLLWKVHLAATLAMAGIVWYVQLVQYPLFAQIPEEVWEAYARSYTQRAGLVIGPIMLIEACSGLFLLISMSKGLTRRLFGLALLLLGLVWASTFGIQVPLHDSLQCGWDDATWETLVFSNWIRTVLWTARIVLLLRIAGKLR